MRQNIAALTTFSIVLGALAAFSGPAAEAQASGPVRFFCGKDSKGIPATMVEVGNKGKGPTPIIRWVSEYFSGSGYTPDVRCSIVSKKFMDAYQKNPNFLFTASILNRQPVVCAANQRQGACDSVLYTVKQGVQDPIVTMLRLEKVRAGASGPLNESTGGGGADAAYVSVQDLVQSVVASAPGATATTPSPDAAPTTTPKTGEAALW